ncbi:MAG: hypothetical protein KDJ65_00875 [Anaerolineae bacterium]|nr:hypothetical protein [Anaerolineae bacterium]
MKAILLVCHQDSIDIPLRRSLAHLSNSCQIEILTTGHQALDELKVRAFDLVIIDSLISDLDSLELVESVSYLDPDVPVILMLSTAHHLLATPARALGTNPILRPFRPLEFLRLVDTLLHQHLERYRDLARLLRRILESLAHQMQAQHIFLVDAVSQTVAITLTPEHETIRCLAQQAIDAINDDAAGLSSDRWAIDPDHELSKRDQTFFINIITENIYLVLVFSEGASLLDSERIWTSMEQAAVDIRKALMESVPSSSIFLADEELAGDEVVAAVRLYIAPSQTDPILSEQNSLGAWEEPNAVNWQLISETPNVFDRLKHYC